MEMLQSWLVILPVCTAIGWAIGSLQFCHFSLGSSAVLFVAMGLGALGASMPPAIRDLGLMMFIYAVGSETSEGFWEALTKRGPKLALTAAVTVFAGFLTVVLYGCWAGLSPFAMAGLFGGALTSTPALATAMDGLSPQQTVLLTTAYGLAYPAGIIGVVLFVQLIGRLERVDIAAEEQRMGSRSEGDSPAGTPMNPTKTASPIPVLAVIGLGYIAGHLPIPLPGGSTANLGSAGGVLLCSIIAACKGTLGRMALVPARPLRFFLREFGLYAFLAGVGMHTGNVIDMETLRNGMDIVFGSIITVTVPMLICWWLSRRLFGIEFLTMLGTITGSMTSTPGLAAATSVSQHRSIIQGYATVYPIALLSMILMIKLLYLFVVPVLLS